MYTHMCIFAYIKNTHTQRVYELFIKVRVPFKANDYQNKVSAAPHFELFFSLEDTDREQAGLAFSVQILQSHLAIQLHSKAGLALQMLSFSRSLPVISGSLA